MTKKTNKKIVRGKVQNRLVKKVPKKENKGTSNKSVKTLPKTSKKAVLKEPAKKDLVKPKKVENKVSQETESMVVDKESKQQFPTEFPFWARLKISKNRTTLVIDEDKLYNNKKQKIEDMFIHREVISKNHKGFEEIKPNPDPDRAKKNESAYLKPPRKIPKYLVKPHNKNLNMPQFLIDRYSKNNKK